MSDLFRTFASRKKMIMNNTTIKAEALLMMFIIAYGEHDGEQFIYYPNLPSCLSRHLDFTATDGGFADLLSIRVNSEGGIDCWFQDDFHAFYYSWEAIKKTKPMLAASVLTHVYDMVENLKEC